MLQLLKAKASHEDLFIERYDQLLRWALQLAEHNRGLAEDLVHDAFVHFTVLTRPDLQAIQNLDAYFYATLRNLHISHQRRASRSRFQQLSIVEYESAATGLRTLDACDLIQTQNDLRSVCHYACARKETAKIASVLILRFFHGYYPTEIARILRSSRPAVDKALQLARAEAKVALTDPQGIAFKDVTVAPTPLRTAFARANEDLLSELQQRIFAAEHGDCWQGRDLKEFYGARVAVPMDCLRLAHVVSCAKCLDQINTMLKLPPLAERSPTDSIGKDTSGKGTGGGGEAGGGGETGQDSKRAIRRSRQRARESFEHRPQELCVSVNGYIQGAQKIASEISELDLSANLGEGVNFVEVFSEQGIRLLLLNADGPPPQGSDTQTSRAELSEGRSIELTVRHRSSWPSLHLIYSDPLFKSVGEIGAAALDAPDDDALDDLVNQSAGSSAAPTTAGWQRQSFHRALCQIEDRLGLNLLLRPATVTAFLAFALIAALILVQFPRTPVASFTAADLLAQSAAAEELLLSKKDQVIHRTLRLEERTLSSVSNSAKRSNLIATNRIEIWQRPEKGITARRLYDEKGRLVAGDWRRADGVQTIYHHGASPHLQLPPEQRGGLTVENVWQLSPSAKEFAVLIGEVSRAQVEKRSNCYVLTYSPLAPTSSLSKVTLVLSLNDLRPLEEAFVIRQGDELKEFRLIEVGLEAKRSTEISSAVFEPEPELLTPAKSESPKSAPVLSTPITNAPPSVATAELEIDLLRRLNQAGALLGEQVSLSRTRDGLLQLQGIVETDQRKREILNVLGAAATDPAVRIDLQTVSEAVAKQKPSASAAITLQQLESAKSTVTVDSELRKYFSSTQHFSGNELDQAIRVFGEQMLNHSRQARRHALALKQIVERFSPEQVRTLSATARGQWHALVREHAKICQSELATLHLELQPIFGSSADDKRGDVEVSNDEDLLRAATRLFELAAANDDAVRTAFSVSDENASAVRIRAPQFWDSLQSAQKLAARIGVVSGP